MSILQAAEHVLAEAAAPMGSQELMRQILAQGLWQTAGRTPEQTLNARLAIDIKRLGTQSKFQRTGPGVFALRAWGLSEHVIKRSKPNKATTRKPEAVTTVSFTDAAEQVLERFGDRKPMHYRAITQMALEHRLIKTQGQTPEATLFAQIVTEIARQARRGQTPRFAKHGNGFVGLAKWMATGLAFQIEQHNKAVRAKLRARLLATPPAEFEALLGKLLTALGFEEVMVTGRSGDGGIDLRGTLVVGDVIRTRMAVQAKRWRRNVQAPTVQQVRGSLGTHEQGLIITTSDFSAGARREAERPDAIPVGLMSGEQLVTLLVEHTIGVQRRAYDVIALGEAEET